MKASHLWVTSEQSATPLAPCGGICMCCVSPLVYSAFLLSPVCIFIRGGIKLETLQMQEVTWNMFKVIMGMIKHLSWGVATVHRIHSGRSGLAEKLPTTSTSLIPGAWPPSAHITSLCLCLRLHCGPDFHFSRLQKNRETGSPCLQVGSLELRARVSVTFIISKAVVRFCVRVCVCVCSS